MALLDEVRAANDAYADGIHQGRSADAAGAQVRGRRLHGRPARPGQGARSGRRRRACHPQRGRPRRRCACARSSSRSVCSARKKSFVVHHTDCGMLTFDNRHPSRHLPASELDADASDIDFLPFSDLEQSVRDDVELIRSSPLIAE